MNLAGAPGLRFLERQEEQQLCRFSDVIHCFPSESQFIVIIIYVWGYVHRSEDTSVSVFPFIFMRVLGIELILLDFCGCWTISLVPGGVVVKCLHYLLERLDYSLPGIIFITMICYSWVVCDHVTLGFSAHWYLCVDALCPWPRLRGLYPQELSKYIFPSFPLRS